MKRFLLRCKENGFTLLELLTVIAIIVVLAGLILSGMGYAQQKAASERARAEIAAMSLALESYKIDNGDYPRALVSTTVNITDVLNARLAYSPSTTGTATTVYQKPATVLYQALSGTMTGKVYFNFKPDMLASGTSTGAAENYVIDPFGYSYGYSTMGSVSTTGGYNPTFDLWSTGGQTAATGTGKWITNW